MLSGLACTADDCDDTCVARSARMAAELNALAILSIDIDGSRFRVTRAREESDTATRGPL
jgi:hypothetical protein